MNCVNRSLVVTYVDRLQMSLSVAELVEKLTGCSRVFNSKIELENHCRKHDVAVLLLVWPFGANPLQEDDFNRLMAWLDYLHSNNSFLQSILIIQHELSVGQSCLAITSGVTAIADFSQSDFDETLDEYVSDAYQCYLEKSSRHNIDETPDASAYGLIGHSSALREVVNHANRASGVSDAPVVIYGESGTGKQRLAEMIHALDEKRSNYPFISVNCASITGSLAESELFGHRKGAFTGATEDRQGYFRAANKGTILLDEIGELSLSLQPKILRVLQDAVVMPVGSDKEYSVDLRIIAATHRDLKQMILQGKFRLDLYQRLNVIQLHVPSLRERAEDIPVLFEAFLEKYAHYSRCEINGVDPLVYEILGETLGSGNIRELENLVRQILIFKEQGHRIEISDLPLEIIRRASGQQCQDEGEGRLKVSEELIESLVCGQKTLSNAVDEYEELMLRRLINRNVSQTTLADRLGITRRTLYNKLHKYHLR